MDKQKELDFETRSSSGELVEIEFGGPNPQKILGYLVIIIFLGMGGYWGYANYLARSKTTATREVEIQIRAATVAAVRAGIKATAESSLVTVNHNPATVATAQAIATVLEACYPNCAGMNLSGGYLKGAMLTLVDLSGADLSGVVLSFANLTKADLSEANLNRASLTLTDLSESHLRNTNLSEADLRGVTLNLSDLSKADLSETDLFGATLLGANLRAADLHEANLHRVDLRGANLNGAILISADLSGADLGETDLFGANLQGANLRETNLRGADLNQINLEGAQYNLNTIWPDGFRPEQAGPKLVE